MRCPISFHSRRAAIAALFAETTLFKREHRRSPTTWDAGFEVIRATGEPVHDAVLRRGLIAGHQVEGAARMVGGPV